MTMRRAATTAIVFLGLVGVAPAASFEPYMPSSGWSRDDEAELFENWVGRQLRAMEEPALSSPAGRAGFKRRFRMLVLPTFHHAYAIRVDEPTKGVAKVRAVRLDGRGGYSPGKILEQESYVPDRAALRRLYRTIAGVGLADLPRLAAPQAEDGAIRVCADGVRIVFELVDQRGNHLVTRGCDMDRRLWRLVDSADGLRRSVGSDLRKYR